MSASGVTANFFSTLGVTPAPGRNFTLPEERVGHNRVVIISRKLWQRRFASGAGVLGKTITLDGDPYIVVGIAPPLHPDFDADVYVPLPFGSKELGARGERMLAVVGRLKQATQLTQAQAEMDAIAQAVALENPDTNTNWCAKVEPFHEAWTKYYRATLFLFLGAVGLVLLIACADVANLLLVRTASRRGEFAIRVALGAGRRVLARQLLIENATLGLLGGALGTLVAVWGTRLFARFSAGVYTPLVNQAGLDLGVLGFAIAISLLSAIAAGVAPATFASKLDLSGSLRETGRTMPADSRSRRAQRVFVIAEVALALVLLFGAGLFVNSLLRLERAPTGFDPHNLVTMRVSVNSKNYDDHRILSFCRQLLQRSQAVPGVQAVALASSIPFTGSSAFNFIVEGQPRPAPGEEPDSLARAVTADYFHTMRIPLLKGRYFTDGDNERSPRVAIINENLARQFFRSEDPVGRYITILPPRYSHEIQPGTLQIVGVAGNVKEVGLDEVPFGDIYLPFLQNPVPTMFLVARTPAGSAAVTKVLRAQVFSLDKDQPVYSIRIMEERISNSLAGNRFNMFLIVVFAALAVVLACVGVYGVISYSVAQRTHEVGIRMALGARAADVLRLVVGQGVGLAITGVTIGVGVSVGLGHALRNVLYMVPYSHNGLLYEVSPVDPLTFLWVSALLPGVGFVASYIPARRATKVDPMVALRYE